MNDIATTNSVKLGDVVHPAIDHKINGEVRNVDGDVIPRVEDKELSREEFFQVPTEEETIAV